MCPRAAIRLAPVPQRCGLGTAPCCPESHKGRSAPCSSPHKQTSALAPGENCCSSYSTCSFAAFCLALFEQVFGSADGFILRAVRSSGGSPGPESLGCSARVRTDQSCALPYAHLIVCCCHLWTVQRCFGFVSKKMAKNFYTTF